MKFSGIFDIPKLQDLMEGLYLASGIPSTIIDIDGNTLVKVGWLDICTKFHGINIENELGCRQSDQYFKEHLSKQGSIEPYVCYKCLYGLIDAGAPIVIDGEYLATIQFLFKEPDIEKFCIQAGKYGFDEEEYLKELANIPIYSKNKLDSIMHFFLQFAEMLGKTSVDRFRLIESRNKAFEATRQLQAANESLQNLSFLDGLTCIANRRHFDQKLLQESKRAKREKTQLSLIMLDVDYFKAFNDTYGHLKGDECLKIVASTLKMTLKRPGDFLARYGGEEFTVILPDTDDIGAVIIAEKLRASIEKADIAHINSLCAIYVTVSIGVVTRFSEQTETPDDMILAADRALYRSKHEGRNRVSMEQLYVMAGTGDPSCQEIRGQPSQLY